MQLTVLFIGVAINLVLVALLYFYLNSKIKKRDTSVRILAEIRGELEEMIVELNQTADRNINIIEERITRLAKTIEEADRRIRLLQKSTDTFTMSSATYSRIKPRVANQPSLEKKKTEDREDRSSELDFEGKGRQPEKNSPAAVNGETEKENGNVPGEKKAGDCGLSGMRAQVRELHEQGLSSELIAARVGATLGEVNLMITLMEEKHR
jgi:hypothetical protein